MIMILVDLIFMIIMKVATYSHDRHHGQDHHVHHHDQDYGNYSCTGHNKLGSSSASLLVTGRSQLMLIITTIIIIIIIIIVIYTIFFLKFY